MAGAKIYFSPRIYAHTQLGVAIEANEEKGSLFAFSPGTGIILFRKVDVELKYLSVAEKTRNNLNALVLRLAYKL